MSSTSTTDQVKVDSAGMPGEYIRCTRCSEVGEVSLMASHVCPPEEPKVSREKVLDETSELMAQTLLKRWLEYETFSPEERASWNEGATVGRETAIHRWEQYMKSTWDNRLQRVEAAFTPEILRKLALEERDFLLKRTREMRDDEMSLNDERRAKGVPYAKRLELLNKNKIQWCDEQEAKLIRLSKVKPIRKWFDEADYWFAKKLGMRWVVRTKLELIMD